MQTLPYFYYVEHHANPLGRIAINWARIWLMRQSKSWERIAMDYQTKTCTVINTVLGTKKEIRITEGGFKLPGDNVLIVNNDQINQWKEVLLCHTVNS